MLIAVLAPTICLGLATGCGEAGGNCRTVFHPPLDSHEDKSFKIQINPSDSVKLLTIITATYDLSVVEPTKLGSSDTIDFAILDDTGAVVAIPLRIALEFSTRSDRNGVSLKGLRNTTASSHIWDSEEWLHRPDNYHKMFDGAKGSFTIQILQSDSHYEVHIRSPGSSVFKTKYNYKSPGLWEAFSQYRLSESNVVFINRGDPKSQSLSRMITFTSISQCGDALPVLCDERPVKEIPVELGGMFTLTCRARGAPFLSSSWTKAGKVLPSKKRVVIVDDAGSTIVSVIEVPVFSVHDTGTYTCEIGNGFGQKVEQSFLLQYTQEVSILSRPSGDKFQAEEDVKLSWLLEGWPLSEVALKCSAETGKELPTDRMLYSRNWPPRIKLTVIIDLKNAPGSVVNCRVFNSSHVLDTRSFRRVACGEGQVETIDHKCVPLKPSSTAYDIGIAVVSVLLLVVSIIAVCLARKVYCSCEVKPEDPVHYKSFLSYDIESQSV